VTWNASKTREGTRGQGDTGTRGTPLRGQVGKLARGTPLRGHVGKVTRGQGVVLGRDVVAPLPDPVQGASWHVSTLARG